MIGTCSMMAKSTLYVHNTFNNHIYLMYVCMYVIYYITIYNIINYINIDMVFNRVLFRSRIILVV